MGVFEFEPGVQIEHLWVVPWDDMLCAVGQFESTGISAHQISDMEDYRENPLFQRVGIEMCRIGHQHDPATLGEDAHHLQAVRMATDAMHRKARRERSVSVAKAHLTGIETLNESDHVLDIEVFAQDGLAHVGPGGEGRLCFLYEQRRVRKVCNRACVVGVKMRQNDVLQSFWRHPEEPQRLRGSDEIGAGGNLGGPLGAEAGVDEVDLIAAPGQPDEIRKVVPCEVGPSADEVVDVPSSGEAAVFDGEQFKRRRGLGVGVFGYQDDSPADLRRDGLRGHRASVNLVSHQLGKGQAQLRDKSDDHQAGDDYQ